MKTNIIKLMIKSPLVVNCRKDKYDVYIGRPGKGMKGPWGNPFIVGKDGTRDEVVEKYKQWILSQPEMIEKCERELRGKVLGCFCRPSFPCHGDILAEIANESSDNQS